MINLPNHWSFKLSVQKQDNPLVKPNLNVFKGQVVNKIFTINSLSDDTSEDQLIESPATSNRLLTEREGQYSPVRPEQARLVSCLLYGTLFLIVKCTSGAINLFSFLSFSFLSF